jgi:hypothetical protein
MDRHHHRVRSLPLRPVQPRRNVTIEALEPNELRRDQVVGVQPAEHALLEGTRAMLAIEMVQVGRFGGPAELQDRPAFGGMQGEALDHRERQLRQIDLGTRGHVVGLERAGAVDVDARERHPAVGRKCEAFDIVFGRVDVLPFAAL